MDILLLALGVAIGVIIGYTVGYVVTRYIIRPAVKRRRGISSSTVIRPRR